MRWTVVLVGALPVLHFVAVGAFAPVAMLAAFMVLTAVATKATEALFWFLELRATDH